MSGDNVRGANVIALELALDEWTKTLTLVITFKLFKIELSYFICVFIVTRPFIWYHTLIFDLMSLTLKFDLLLKN